MINVYIIFQILMFLVAFACNVPLNKLILFLSLHNLDGTIPFEEKVYLCCSYNSLLTHPSLTLLKANVW